MARVCPIHGDVLEEWADPFGGGEMWLVCLRCREDALKLAARPASLSVWQKLKTLAKGT